MLRDEIEPVLYRKMRKALREHARRIIGALGSPPHAYNATPAFWQDEQETLASVLRPLLEQAAQGAVDIRSGTAKAVAVGAGGGAQTERDKTPITGVVLWDDALMALSIQQWASQYSHELGARLNVTTRGLVDEAARRYALDLGGNLSEEPEDEADPSALWLLLLPVYRNRRAESISITETTVAIYAAGQLVSNAFRANGLRFDRVWYTARDERVCPICGANEDVLESDGWGGYVPPAHPNCRCSVYEIRV